MYGVIGRNFVSANKILFFTLKYFAKSTCTVHNLMSVEKSRDSHTNAKNTHRFLSISVVVTVDNRPIRLQLCDTAGQVRNLIGYKTLLPFL